MDFERRYPKNYDEERFLVDQQLIVHLTLLETWNHLLALVKEDHWVSGLIGAIVALALSGVVFASRWLARLLYTVVSSHYRDAKHLNGNWYLFHWNLIKVTDHKIRMSRLRLHRRLNGKVAAVQAHPQSGNAVFRGTARFDNQNIYIALDCVNDSDIKAITLHRIVDVTSVGVRYTVGVMAGITHQRNPYACRVVLAERPLSEDVLRALLGPRRISLATSSDRDRLVARSHEEPQACIVELDESKYSSPLLDV